MTRSPGKDLHRPDTKKARRIIQAPPSLCDDPSHPIRMVKGGTSARPVYMFRMGCDDRAILSVHDTILIIHVLEVEDRNQAYRDF